MANQPRSEYGTSAYPKEVTCGQCGTLATVTVWITEYFQGQSKKECVFLCANCGERTQTAPADS